MATQKVSRREFIRFAGVAGGAALLSACAPQVVTQVVKETSVVKETVKETQVVEKEVEVIKEVTPTPLPRIVTPQGRELPEDAAPLDKQVWPDFFTEVKFLDVARDIYSSQLALQWATEPMLRNDVDFNLVPAAMESWKPGPNAEYWEFVIRQDSKWSDGQPIVADDVVFTFKHLANPDISGGWGPGFFFADVKGVYKAYTKAGSMDDIGVIKVDDRTVQIYGEYGSIPYLPALVSYQAAIITPKHVAEKDPEHWADNAEGFVGNGPFNITSWDHNVSCIYDISPTYNGPHKPGIQKRICTITTGTFDAFNAWLNKETYLTGLNLQNLAVLRADPQLNPLLHFYANFQSEYIALHNYMPPTDNKALRQALAHSIDRETMCYQVMNGTFVPGYSMLPPNFPGYNPDLQEYQKYDVELAQQKLAESGLDPAKVKIELYSNARDARMEFIKEQWETNLGITVDLIQVEGSVWGDMRSKHTMMAYKGPYEYDYLDPSNMLTGLWRSVPAPEGQTEPWGSPRHGWKNEEFDRLVTEAGGEADAAKRIQMFQDAEKILVEEVGGVFITHNMIFNAWYPWVVGIPADKSGNVVYRGLEGTHLLMYLHKDIDEMMQQY